MPDHSSPSPPDPFFPGESTRSLEEFERLTTLAYRKPSSGDASTEPMTLSQSNHHGGFDPDPAPRAKPSPGVSEDPLIGIRFGRYRVTRKLGSGGAGVVLNGFDEELRREVAIKVAHPHRMIAAEDVQRFFTEGRILAGLDHPGIVPIYDVGRTQDGLCYLVSKFIPGRDLAARMHQGKPSPEEAVRLIAAVAEALHHAHQRGLVHRDVKPANILLDGAGRPVVADFGLALREEDFGKGPTWAGTPPYMSPEQVRQEGHRVDARTDVYSLGVVFYELLTGQRPFRAANCPELVEQIKAWEPRPPRQLDQTIPRELDRICLKMLSKRASDRYSTADDLAEDLLHWLGSQQRKVESVPTTPAPGVRPPLPVPSESEGNTAGVVPKGLRSFEREDANFFLRLLPGPRDREGLPESIRFWKTRLEETDPDRTFRVGLLYGPSGCGKSSLVKAGLLPRLAPRVLTVYVESTPDDTEARLLRGLRKHWPDLPADLLLEEALARLRRGEGPAAGLKVLLVLDQFEQWLHAQPGGPGAELVRILRQCDGGRLQALILVRDDFWMSATRFMRDLEVPLLEGQNSLAVDLFDRRHAQNVLAGFGRAFGSLPEGPPSADQERFIERAVAELAQKEKVIPVRLALFAEMVKGKPWTPATLTEMGGVAGIGVTFLDEMFSAPTAPLKHRLYQKPARATLQALLPEPGSELKGQMRSVDDLLLASGCTPSPKDFEDILHILDAELRLVTPTEREDSGPPAGPASRKYYQLSHDYLVEPLRQWLTAKQFETRAGRAELRLAERTALWTARHESRQLPSGWEWLQIVLWGRHVAWTTPQRQMMAAATRLHLFRGLIAAGLVLLVLITGLLIKGEWEGHQRAAHAEGLVARLLAADVDAVPTAITALDGYRNLTDPELNRIAADPGASPRHQLRARLALLPVDGEQLPALYRHLLAADPDDFLVLCNQLRPHGRALAEPLWRVLQAGESEPPARLRAAGALAAFDPDDERWTKAAGVVARGLVTESPLQLRQWLTALRPVRNHLLPPLGALFRGPDTDPAERALATSILADFAADRPAVLIDLVKDADARQYGRLVGKLDPIRAEAVAGMKAELSRVPAAHSSPQDCDRLLRRQANAAVTLYRLGETEPVWPLFRYSPDPSLRNALLHSLEPLGASPLPLVERLAHERDQTARRALLLCLGEFRDRLPAASRLRVLDQAVTAFRGSPDPGVHSAAEWLLRSWKAGPQLRKAEAGLRGRKDTSGRSWYIDGQGHTLAVIGGAKLPPTPSHGTRVGRPFAIATKEVTVEQFLRFRPNHPYQADPHTRVQQPVNIVSWYDAAAYCRWLSEREGIPEDQMCYPPVAEIKNGMKPYPDYLRRTGYRLPTEAEWERACQAGTRTSPFCGESLALLPHYAWYAANSGYRLHEVGRLKPNDFGLFDMLGNAMEWCQESASALGKNADDVEDQDPVRNDVWRVARGASHHQQAGKLKATQRDPLVPTTAWYSLGFRVVRTHRPGS